MIQSGFSGQCVSSGVGNRACHIGTHNSLAVLVGVYESLQCWEYPGFYPYMYLHRIRYQHIHIYKHTSTYTHILRNQLVVTHRGFQDAKGSGLNILPICLICQCQGAGGMRDALCLGPTLGWSC